MTSPSYIPTTIALLIPWATNFATLLTAAPGDYGLTAGDASAAQTSVDNYVTAQNTALNPPTRTSATIAAASQAKADMLAVIRPRAVLISQNASVTDEAKADIGVTIRSSVRTPVTAPTVAPVLSLIGVRTNAVDLRYLNAETPNSKAAPRGCGGVELVIFYGSSPNPTPEMGVLVASPTKSPAVIDTSGHSGQTATVWARWRTKNGVQGGKVGYSPYSAPLVFVAN